MPIKSFRYFPFSLKVQYVTLLKNDVKFDALWGTCLVTINISVFFEIHTQKFQQYY